MEERNALVLEHRSFAEAIALRHRGIARRFCIDVDDLIQDAMLGLIKGLDAWNPDTWPDSDRDAYLRIWVRAYVRRGLRSLEEPAVPLAKAIGPFGDVAKLPSECTARVRAVRRNGRVVWVVGVTERPKQRRGKRARQDRQATSET